MFAENDGSFVDGAQSRFEMVSELCEIAPVRREIIASSHGRSTKAGNADDILCAAARAALLPAAIENRIHYKTLARLDKRARAFRTADLVRRDRQQVRAERADVARNFSGRLHRIDVQQSTRRTDNGSGFRDRLDHAGFVIGMHQRNQKTRAGFLQLRQLFR